MGASPAEQALARISRELLQARPALVLTAAHSSLYLDWKKLNDPHPI
jgi:hypothetical protein